VILYCLPLSSNGFICPGDNKAEPFSSSFSLLYWWDFIFIVSSFYYLIIFCIFYLIIFLNNFSFPLILPKEFEKSYC